MRPAFQHCNHRRNGVWMPGRYEPDCFSRLDTKPIQSGRDLHCTISKFSVRPLSPGSAVAKDKRGLATELPGDRKEALVYDSTVIQYIKKPRVGYEMSAPVMFGLRISPLFDVFDEPRGSSELYIRWKIAQGTCRLVLET